MIGVLKDFDEAFLVAAIETSVFEFVATLRHWSRAQVHDDRDMLWTITDAPFVLFNGVLRAQLEPPSVDAAIEAAIARCQSKDVPMFWRTGPATRPANLGESLEAHGFVRARDSTGMAVDLRALNEDVQAPTGLTIERVGDLETLKTWCHTLVSSFPMPDLITEPALDWFASIGFAAQAPVRSYLGRLNGEPVATSQLLLAAGVAGIYGVSTRPDARRQGLGTALTLAALREGRELGYRVGVLGATDEGALSVYQKIGFREYCKMGIYVWKPQSEGEEDSSSSPTEIDSGDTA